MNLKSLFLSTETKKGISLSVTAYPLDIIIILDAIQSSTARPCCYDTWQSTGRLRHVPRE